MSDAEKDENMRWKHGKIVLIALGALMLVCTVGGLLRLWIGARTPAAGTAITGERLDADSLLDVETSLTPEPEAAVTLELPTPTPEPTPTATRTPAPTVTLEPTATATSEPTPTPTPTMTVAELAYVEQMEDWADSYARTLTDLLEHLDRVVDDSTLLVDVDWRLQASVLLTGMRNLNDDAHSLDPPPVFEDVHRDVLSATRHYDNFVTLFAQGIDDQDVDQIHEACQELYDAASSMITATEAMQAKTH
jgi:hypothetical protein